FSMASLPKPFTCPNGHHWQVPRAGPLAVAVECICCPECGAPAETLPPGGSSPAGACTPPDLPARASEETGGCSAGPASTPAGPASNTEVPLALAGHPRYRVLTPLGAGGMGTVYKAEHQLMERLVALKGIDPPPTAHPAADAA